jgi:hypothetical protein
MTPQEQEFLKLGDEIARLKEQSRQDLYDLSALSLIPLLFERLIDAAKAMLGEVEQAVQTINIFWDNYQQMKQANTIGADDYFHSKANAEAAQLGETGESTAKFISDAQEFFDYYNNLHLKKLSLEATIQDAAKDQRANAFGREQGRNNPHAEARDLVEPLRPEGLDERY